MSDPTVETQTIAASDVGQMPPEWVQQSGEAAARQKDGTYDINDPALQAEMVESNPDKDFFEQPPPPADGRHHATVGLGDKGIYVKRQSKKGDLENQPTGAYFAIAEVECTINDGESVHGTGMSVYDFATSIIMNSSGTSRLHGILRAIGAPAPARLSLPELCRHVTNVMASESAQCDVETQWEGQIKKTNPKTGKDEYVVVVKGMKNFPPDETSPTGFSPIYVYTDKETKEIHECRARAQVVRFYLPGA